jgi:hypothetical protein
MKVASVTVKATTHGLIAARCVNRAGVATLVAKSFPQNSLIESGRRKIRKKHRVIVLFQLIQQKRDRCVFFCYSGSRHEQRRENQATHHRAGRSAV